MDKKETEDHQAQLDQQDLQGQKERKVIVDQRDPKEV